MCDYGATRALRGVDVSARGHEILAVFGPNAAGKSTLLRTLSGERRPDRGRVFFDGAVVSGGDPAWRARIGLVSHRTGLYGNLSVSENLRFFASLQGSPGSRAALIEVLEQVCAAEVADTRTAILSRGQRQRVALARSLLHNPEILFLDEPFTGLDPGGVADLETVLRAIRLEGKIVVLVTHDIPRGLKLADRMVVLRDGRKVLDGPTADRRVEDVVPLFGASFARDRS